MDKRVLALGRMKAGRMNKTEAAYADRLEQHKRDGRILWYAFEGITLKLADKTRYTPDFAVMSADGVMELHETKGVWRDDAKVKIKVAAELYPFRFMAVYLKDGAWQFEAF